RMEDLEPYSLGRPAHEAIVKRLARAVQERRISPAATGLQHMHNPTDHPAIIDARLAASVGRQMRHKPRELTIVQPEMSSIHRGPPSGTLNQKMRCLGIRFMGPSSKAPLASGLSGEGCPKKCKGRRESQRGTPGVERAPPLDHRSAFRPGGRWINRHEPVIHWHDD